MDRRIQGGVERGPRFEISVDGKKVIAYEGETIAAALLAAGKITLRHTPRQGEARSMYCGIGLCHECMMVINGVPNTLACQTPATPGCQVFTQQGLEVERKHI